MYAQPAEYLWQPGALETRVAVFSVDESLAFAVCADLELVEVLLIQVSKLLSYELVSQFRHAESSVAGSVSPVWCRAIG